MRRARKKKGKIFFLILISLLVLYVIGHNILLYRHSQEFQGANNYYEVKGKKMHVYDSQRGSQTLVLLSGYGTGSPIVDFRPLTSELESDYRVIVVEYLGYGDSQDTLDDRTIENISEELHTLLSKLRIEEPYILVPHSISGIYSIYYASQYPDEVAAIIGIENAVPEQLLGVQIPISSMKEKIIKHSGILRILSIFAPSLLTPHEMKAHYSKEELKYYRKALVNSYQNHTQKDEMDRYEENGRKALNADLSNNIPMLFILSKAVHNDPEKWIKDHELTLKEQDIGQIVELHGSHYLHRTQYIEISQFIRNFIDTYLD